MLDTAQFLDPSGGGATWNIPPYSTHFRARAYDHTSVAGQQVWPPPGPGAPIDTPCVGGALRAVTWNVSADANLDPGTDGFRGWQPKFLGLGGSIATMVTLFPSTSQSVESHYWCTPGIEAMTSDADRFNVHMNAWTNNTLIPTHYEDFLNHVVWTTTHWW